MSTFGLTKKQIDQQVAAIGTPAKKAAAAPAPPKAIVGTAVRSNPVYYSFRGKTFTMQGGKFYDASGKALGAAGTAAIKDGLLHKTAKVIPKPGTTVASPSKAAAISGLGNADGTSTVDGANPVSVPTDDDWLANDSAYQGQITDAQQGLTAALMDSQKQRQQYGATVDDDLRQLGYQGSAYSETVDPKTGAVTGGQYSPGTWNTSDVHTQSGRALVGQQNDFAARGMLQSSGYGDALTETYRGLNDQVTNAAKGRQTYDDGLASYDAAQQAGLNTTVAQAKAAAIARKAAQYATAASGVLSA